MHWNFKVSLRNKILKKVTKVAVLLSICSDLGPGIVYSNEMHSEKVNSNSEMSNLISVTVSICLACYVVIFATFL